MCFHLSWLSSFERLAYINNHHCFIYLVKAVYCGVPNKPIICLFDFGKSFYCSTVLFSLQVVLALSIFEIKRLTVFSSPRLLHPIWFRTKFLLVLKWIFPPKVGKTNPSYAMNMHATLGQHAGKMLATLQQYTGNMLATYCNMLGTCWQ